MRPSPFTTTISQIAPITLITACMFSHVPGQGDGIKIVTIGISQEFDDDTNEIMGNAKLFAALGEADANVSSGDLADGPDIAG